MRSDERKREGKGQRTYQCILLMRYTMAPGRARASPFDCRTAIARKFCDEELAWRDNRYVFERSRAAFKGVTGWRNASPDRVACEQKPSNEQEFRKPRLYRMIWSHERAGGVRMAVDHYTM